MRLKKGSNAIYNRLKTLCPEKDKRDEASAELSQAFSAYTEVHLEIGMKAGARLIHQLLLTEDK